MPELRLTLKDGKPVTLQMPDPGSGPSAFLLSLPKAGSTLFYRIMSPIANRAGLPFYSLPNELNGVGVPFVDIAEGLGEAFRPTGYTFGGFRGFDRAMTLPDYASGRTVLLVRDPRDMLTSLYFSEAKSHEAPGTSASDALLKQFEARRQSALSRSIDDFVLQRASGLVAAYQTIIDAIGAKDYKLFRYEDVIFDKPRWIAETLSYLRLAAPAKLVANVIEKNDIRPAAEDDTQHIRKVAPGDHREKLRPETIAALNARFAPLVERFGYTFEAPQPAAATTAAEPEPAVDAPPPSAAPAAARSAEAEARAARLREERRAERVAQRRAEAQATRR